MIVDRKIFANYAITIYTNDIDVRTILKIFIDR